MALLPGVFALLLAGVSGVAASGNPAPAVSGMLKASPTPCAYFTKSGTCCPNPKKPCTTPSPKSGPPGSGNTSGGAGSTPAPTPVPTSTPNPTSTPGPTTTAGPTGTPGPTSTPTSPPVASPGGSGGGHSSAGGAAGTTGPSGATGATHTQTSVDPTPFAPLASVVTTRGLDSARIPPVEALTPLSGLAFGNGLNLGPILLLIDLVGIGLLVYLVRTRWLGPEA
jgi:hypothetical protein